MAQWLRRLSINMFFWFFAREQLFSTCDRQMQRQLSFFLAFVIFAEDIFRILLSCMEINTQLLMEELAPWHDPRHRTGRAGFDRRGRNFWICFFCPTVLFHHLNSMQSGSKSSSRSHWLFTKHQKKVVSTMRCEWVANVRLLYVQKTLFALWFEVWK
jgi:hypothetical protein